MYNHTEMNLLLQRIPESKVLKGVDEQSLYVILKFVHDFGYDNGYNDGRDEGYHDGYGDGYYDADRGDD